jgi:2'-5' RNA ligase
MSEQEPGEPALKRLFFALWPDVALQDRLHDLAATMLPPGSGRPTPSSNIHLTLAFLGPVAADKQVCCETAVGGVRARRFTLALDALGCFRRSGILWVGAEHAPEDLLALVRALSEALRDCGYEPDPRPFRAHLTLARRLRRCPRFPSLTPIDWAVNDFVLVESHTGAGGAQYEILRRWQLF